MNERNHFLMAKCFTNMQFWLQIASPHPLPETETAPFQTYLSNASYDPTLFVDVCITTHAQAGHAISMRFTQQCLQSAWDALYAVYWHIGFKSLTCAYLCAHVSVCMWLVVCCVCMYVCMGHQSSVKVRRPGPSFFIHLRQRFHLGSCAIFTFISSSCSTL